MRKIFLYECKRLLWNKFFAGLVLVLLFYGWQVLRRVTILGVSHTAPFSPWSFGDFLSRDAPAALDRGAVFPDLLHLGKSPTGSSAHRRGSPSAPPVRPGPVRRRSDRAPPCWRWPASQKPPASMGSISAGMAGAAWYFPRWSHWSLRWCSHWAAAGCWECSGPGCSMSGCWFLPSVWRSPCRNRWGCGTGASSPSIP